MPFSADSKRRIRLKITAANKRKDSNENDSLPVHEKKSMTFFQRGEYPERDFVQAGPI